MNLLQQHRTLVCSCITVFIVILVNTSTCVRIVPVYDIRTEEKFAFPEEFMRLVLLQQSSTGDDDSLVYAMEPLDKEGYIINENGQIVPFKIYKKGGASMCVLHPRNCRGGFHKRIPGDTLTGSSDNLYELQVYKRKVTHEEKPKHVSRYVMDDDDIFDPVYDYNTESDKRPDDIESLENSFFPNLRSSYKTDDTHRLHSSNEDRTLAAYHGVGSDNDNHKHANYDNLRKAEQSPRESSLQSSVVIDAVPIRSLWNDFVTDYTDNRKPNEDVDIYNLKDGMGIYSYRRRR